MRRFAGWWRGRASLYIFGGVLVAAVVASGAVLAFTDGDPPPVAASATAPQKHAAARSDSACGMPAGDQRAARSDSACGMPAGDQRVPLQPPRAHWDKVGEYQVPGATNVGPGVVDGHVRRCYARSPTGAVFAAWNFLAIADTTDDAAVMRALTAPGEARDAAIRRGSPPPDPNTASEMIGFRVLDYSPARATVVVGYRIAPKPSAEMDLGQAGSQLVAIQLDMLWLDGDWKAVLSPGDTALHAEPLDSIAGLVQWEPQR